MHIAFRVEGNSQIGLGHLMRCLALAQHGVKKGYQISFLMTSPSYEQALKRSDWVGEVSLVENAHNELDELERFCLRNKVDALFLDGYQFTSAYRCELATILKTLSVLFVAIDDNNDLGKLYADCIINSNSHASSLNYHQTESNAHCCLGDSFRILRGEFHLTPKQQIEAKRLENRSALTIILGGADTTNWSLELAAKFSNALPSIPINVITGGAFPHATQLSKFADETINVTHWHNAQHVSDIFLASRLVISAGGSTQYELQALYTPAMLLIVADNQFQACMQSYNTGKAVVLDTRSGMESCDIVKQGLGLWHDEMKLKAIMNINATQASINGADNIFSAVIKLKSSLGK